MFRYPTGGTKHSRHSVYPYADIWQLLHGESAEGRSGPSTLYGVTKPVLAETKAVLAEKNVGRWENPIPTVKVAFCAEINSFEYDIMLCLTDLN